MKQQSQPPNDRKPSSRPRIALYSHDTMGLGHKRRNRLLAKTLAQAQLNADILMIMGIYEQNLAPMPQGVDYLTLPALCKEGNGQYRSRFLNLPFQDLIQLRSKIIKAALKKFQPDIFIVDNVPRGVGQELDPVLKLLRRQPKTTCILGLRDILDHPKTVCWEWEKANNIAAIRKFYDAIWVYGDPRVYDLQQEHQLLSDVADKLQYLGYLDQRCHLEDIEPSQLDALSRLNLPPGKLVLCCVGGGQDGAMLAESFVRASLPPNTNGVLLTGPFMPKEIGEYLQAQVAHQLCRRVLNFFCEPTCLISQADRVISMGGYNTICEILSFAKPALLVPRVQPRQEQWIRAQRLKEMDLVEVLHPEYLTPEVLSGWLERDCPKPQVRDQINFNGLNRFTQEIAQLLAQPVVSPGEGV